MCAKLRGLIFVYLRKIGKQSQKIFINCSKFLIVSIDASVMIVFSSSRIGAKNKIIAELLLIPVPRIGTTLKLLLLPKI